MATAAMMKNLSEISLEEEKMVDAPSPSSYHLNADAPPFHPIYEPVHLAIYNDGVPALTFTTEEDRYRILHGIQDEALDEGFPPDANDAAELDAAEAFVETMAVLALMEEREEMARSDFNHIKKRWEARRAEGLKGRPHKSKGVVDPARHDNRSHVAVNVRAIVPHSHFAGKGENKTRFNSVMAKLRDGQNYSSKKAATPAPPVQRNLIQQPRKGF